jgi:hypothetical protein
VARIADKLAYLRAADRFFVVEEASSHHYRMEPRLLPAERQALETEEGCTIPPAYAAFLERVGNGGVGPAGGSWLFRVQASAAGRASAHRITRGPAPNRLAEPFPHATAWMPGGINLAKIDRSDYLHPRQNNGTIGLARLPESGGRDLVLLVVNGPERGHLWLDRRERGGGIVPHVRRGPNSFLAWYEGLLDDAIREFLTLREQLLTAGRPAGE